MSQTKAAPSAKAPHTLEPWRAIRWRRGQIFNVVDSENIILASTIEANARLISAAPELLASVNEFLAMRQAIIDVGGADGPLDQEVITRFAEMQTGVIERARAAVAKAGTK